MASYQKPAVGFAGLGAMGSGMAAHLVKAGYPVHGVDRYPPSLEKLKAVGGQVASSAREAARGSDFFICMVTNSSQVYSVLFDPEGGAINELSLNATIVICSTVPPAFLQQVQDQLTKSGRTDVLLIDSPVSGGTVRAAHGTLTILSSGTAAALERGRALLDEMSEKLYIIPGGIGAASNVKMINQLLAGIHIAAAAEAMALAAKAGLDTREVYNIIVNAAGNSWMFENRVPHMLDNDFTPHSALDIFVKDMGIVTSTAREHGFPLPLGSAAEQLYNTASSQGYGREDDAGLVRIYNQSGPKVHEQPCQDIVMTTTPSTTPVEIEKVAFLGLGAMGQGMAITLVHAGFSVLGYDVHAPAIERFTSRGAKALRATGPAEAASEAQAFVLMVQNAAQVEDVLFGAGNAAESLPNGAVVIINSTVPPSFVKTIGEKLRALGRNIDLVDAPVSGGVTRAALGQLTIISSGTESALLKANSILQAMSGPPKNLYKIKGGVGAASSVKLINQLLAGVHIVAAAEAMAFGAKLGLDTERLYEIIRNAAGGSWMFENRVPAMLDGDWTPHSALAIFVKDMGIVLDEARRLVQPVTLSAVAHQIYLFGSMMGWSKEADGGIVRFWEQASGVPVAMPKPQPERKYIPKEYKPLPLKETIESLPPPYKGDVMETIQNLVSSGKAPALVILDDDPTGTQTCHDIAVLTVWDHATLLAEFKSAEKGFFILTNSRALPPVEARKLISMICANVAAAAKEANKAFEIVLRGDSTLRGHFPDEPEAVEEVLGKFDGWILAPFFFQGGRYTIDDVHYVAEGDLLVPASQTQFAKDATFGYKSSSLRDYVLEKAGDRFSRDNLFSITLEDIRLGGPAKVTSRLLEAPKGSVIIVNSAAESDMAVFAAGLLEAEARGSKYLFRTGAAFVSSRLGISGKPPMSARDLDLDYGNSLAGGLIIAGSYVPKTTEQLQCLREKRRASLHVIELDVEKLISSPEEATKIVEEATASAGESVQRGQDVLVMTSRKLITGDDALASLKIGGAVAAALVQVVQNITVRPRYLIAKGGITSSDAATKGLNIKRGMVVGQAAPGVPLWRCSEETSRHKSIPYVVFPGNVGTEDTLANLVERWAV